MSAIIEVMIGIVFIYSLLSILVTQINSIISNTLNLRAHYLRDGIDDLLTDPVLRAKVFAHPLVRLIPETVLPDQKITSEQAEALTQGALNAVSWIDSHTFVNVLLNIIKADADQELFAILLTVIDEMPSGPARRTLRLLVNRIQTTGEGLDELRDYIAHMENDVYRNALSESLDKIDDEIGQLGMDPSGIVSVIAGLRSVKNPFFRVAMETVLSTSKTIQEAEEKLSKWFDDGMARSSQAFGRRMQQFSLLVGFIIVLIVNIDSLQVANALWNDPILRQSVVATAESTDVAALIDESDAAATTEDNATIEDVSAATAAAQDTVQDILDLRLPVGWHFTNVNDLGNAATDSDWSDHRNIWNYLPGNSPSHWLTLVLAKLVGLLVTTVAIAQGAPFWFDVMRRLTGR